MVEWKRPTIGLLCGPTYAVGRGEGAVIVVAGTRTFGTEKVVVVCHLVCGLVAGTEELADGRNAAVVNAGGSRRIWWDVLRRS
jgi:hypothetical protein